LAAKGTGRARHASNRSPIWRHGGVVFGPKSEKVYGGKINKKMRRKALAMLLSAKMADNMLIMMDDLSVSQPKTREMVNILASIKKNVENFKKGRVLIALPGYEKNLILASRNLEDVRTIEAAKLNVLDLLNSKYLLMPVKAIDSISRLNTEDSQKAAKPVKTAKSK